MCIRDRTYGGTVVNMSTYTDNYVNPLEMDVWSLDPVSYTHLFYEVKPNLMQMPHNCSFICTDPKGEILRSCGQMLKITDIT